MSDLIVNGSSSPFDSIRRIDESGDEFWYARELMPVLGYQVWRRFNDAIEIAKENLETVTEQVFDHFLTLESKTQGRPRLDYKLSRLACYHVALSCDSRGNERVKLAKHYFAVKTRQAETAPIIHVLPKTYKEALLALVKEVEARELLEEQNQILESENEKLAEAVDELFEYSSIIRVAKFNDVSETSFNWRLLMAASNKLGIEIKKVPCPRYGTKNLYHHQAWRLAYPEYRLPETTTLVIKR